MTFSNKLKKQKQKTLSKMFLGPEVLLKIIFFFFLLCSSIANTEALFFPPCCMIYSNESKIKGFTGF